jgi:heme/copper-type cytochrome/quinol oxidase subunit 4
MTYFWAIWGFDALMALVFFYFFFIGLADGSVSSFNMKQWLAIIAVLLIVLLGSLWLKSNGKMGLAKSILTILAIPGLTYALFVLAMLIIRPRWN